MSQTVTTKWQIIWLVNIVTSAFRIFSFSFVFFLRKGLFLSIRHFNTNTLDESVLHKDAGCKPGIIINAVMIKQLNGIDLNLGLIVRWQKVCYITSSIAVYLFWRPISRVDFSFTSRCSLIMSMFSWTLCLQFREHITMLNLMLGYTEKDYFLCKWSFKVPLWISKENNSLIFTCKEKKKEHISLNFCFKLFENTTHTHTPKILYSYHRKQHVLKHEFLFTRESSHKSLLQVFACNDEIFLGTCWMSQF